jgi:4-amino-4-deoxy-L-arabinose transferase-like glycosyltransferase
MFAAMVGEERRGGRRFWWWLALWTLVGLGIRLGTVYGRFGRKPGGDPAYYHSAANMLVGGLGFINPWLYYYHDQHHVVQTASWPPLFVFTEAIPVVFGFHGFLSSRIWSCVIGAAAVTVTGLAGREIGGRRVGLVAAFLVCVYPNIWMNDELAASEALSPLLVALVLWAAYAFWKRPRPLTVALLGASIGLAALGRDEMSLLVLFILVPLGLLARSLPWRRRIGLVLLGLLAAAVLVMPWVGYNMSRFDKPVYISDGLGVTLASANCPGTWSGRFEGYWSFSCALAAPHSAKVDESVNGADDQHYALTYVRHHLGRLPEVEAARVGRAFGFFHPLDQIRLDSVVETRPYHWALVGLGMYYVLLALSIGGTVVLRRRRVPSFPLWAMGLDSLLSVLITFGQTRYRTTFEVSLCLLAAVQLEWLWGRATRRRVRPDRAAGAEPAREPVTVGV